MPSLQNDNRNLLADLKIEIPFFIDFLLQRAYSTNPTTRMWFKAEQISTQALKHIKRFNRNRLETEMAQILLQIMDFEEGLVEISFCVTDMQEWLQRKLFNNRDLAAIRKVLQDEWKLKPSSNSNSYNQYRIGFDGTISKYNHKGRFYTIEIRDILKHNNIDDLDEKNITI